MLNVKKIELNPKRNYGIDFLRILSMLFVLLLHILKQGGILSALDKLSLGYNLAWFLEVCAYCAVNCYALISGFIGYGSKHKYSNIINLYIQTAFYALLATGVFYVISPDEIGEKAFIKAILPFGFNLYWYFTAYFCMFFFIPFMNKVLETCDKKQLTGLVVFSIMFFSVFPLIFEKDIFFTNNGYSVIWISILYMIGGYIRKYEIYKKISNLKCVVLYFAGVFITFGQKVIVEYVKLKLSGETVNEGAFIKYTSPTMVLCAISLLCLFAKVNFKDGMKKVTAIFSPFAFSVYLIHTAPFVWSKVMKNRFVMFADFNPFGMVVAVLVTAVSIFLLCSFIDFIRTQLFKLLKIKELSIKIESFVTKLFDKKESVDKSEVC
ncbi:MAG: acyltransferase [Ruminococcaceae bacterium]|nr:acyltransferase [Oscillospiraceae bacterium]